jgi:hypothetical protein
MAEQIRAVYIFFILTFFNFWDFWPVFLVAKMTTLFFLFCWKSLYVFKNIFSFFNFFSFFEKFRTNEPTSVQTIKSIILFETLFETFCSKLFVRNFLFETFCSKLFVRNFLFETFCSKLFVRNYLLENSLLTLNLHFPLPLHCLKQFCSKNL